MMPSNHTHQSVHGFHTIAGSKTILAFLLGKCINQIVEKHGLEQQVRLTTASIGDVLTNAIEYFIISSINRTFDIIERVVRI